MNDHIMCQMTTDLSCPCKKEIKEKAEKMRSVNPLYNSVIGGLNVMNVNADNLHVSSTIIHSGVASGGDTVSAIDIPFSPDPISADDLFEEMENQ